MSIEPLDVIVVTIIPPELRAAITALQVKERAREKDAAGTIYYRGAARSALSGQELRIGITCVGSAGNSDAAAAVRDAIAWGSPRAVLLMGIAAGVRGHVRLGDVVLSERIVAYEPAALVAGPGGSHVEARPEIHKLSHAINQDVVNYHPDPERLIQRLDRIGIRFPSPTADAGIELAPTLKPRKATIASGEKLLRDPTKMGELRELHGQIAALDMESAGVVAACHRDGVPWLVIRGISDFGDAHKNDRYHDLASGAAAVVLADFLERGLDLVPRARSAPRPRLNMAPRYPDERTRGLSEQLQHALQRRDALAESDAKTDAVNREIVRIKQQLREGGQLRAGDTLGGGRYLLLETLGRGGFASVWKARDRTQQGVVAIKVLHPDLAGDPIRRERFCRGARVMAELDHPAVARVLEPMGEDSGFYYFVLELAQGGDLRHAVLEGRFTQEQVLRALIQLGEALAHAHANGIVHRDVKPANVLLDERGQPMLTDFDLVTVGDTTGGTRTGALGTVLYTAPECLHHPQDADRRADVYGLGMVALFCLHGAELPVEVLRGSGEIIESLDCDERVRCVLRQATAWKKEQRLASVEAFCEALREVTRSAVTGGEPMVKPGTDILSWVTDGRNDETVWLTQDGDGVRILARAPTLILAAGDQVWSGKRVKRPIKLLAPEVRELMWSEREAALEQTASWPTIDGELDDIVISHVGSGSTMSLGRLETDESSFENSEAYFELQQSVELLGSVGPYLFIRGGWHYDSGGAHPVYHASFHILDLRTGKTVDLLTPAERAILLADEGQHAAVKLRERAGDYPEGDRRPELTLFRPIYAFGDALLGQYQFTGSIYYAGSDNLWSAYTCSELIYSQKIPSALQGYKDPPFLLQRYWAKAPRLESNVRWTAADSSPHVRALLRRLFHEAGDS